MNTARQAVDQHGTATAGQRFKAAVVRRGWSRVVTMLGVVGLLSAAMVAVSGSAYADDLTSRLTTPCQGSQWVQDLLVEPLPGNDFKIVITPNPELRNPVHAFDRDITVDVWHDIQSCVPDLYGGLADSIWQQLECHQEGAALFKPNGEWWTGPTFDLESWHPSLPNPGWGTYFSSHCLNLLGANPGDGTEVVSPGRYVQLLNVTY